jgi:hypothetical protein
MRKPFVLSLNVHKTGLFILFLLLHIPLFPGVIQTGVDIHLRNGKATVQVEYEEKRKKIADYYLQKALLYLPVLETYLDIPFPITHITIKLDENPGHAYKFGWGVKLVKHHLSRKYPSVLYHEFGHFYYRGWTENWLVEGINSFLPVAIAEYGLADKKEIVYDNVLSTWGFGNTNTKNDKPVIIDFRREVWHFFYTKTFKIQYLIYKELGKKRYRSFVQDVSIAMKDHRYTNSSTIHLLQSYKKMDWKKFLSGWVYEGDYEVFSIKDFGDADKNGIIDVVEFYQNNPSALPRSYGG